MAESRRTTSRAVRSVLNDNAIFQALEESDNEIFDDASDDDFIYQPKSNETRVESDLSSGDDSERDSDITNDHLEAPMPSPTSSLIAVNNNSRRSRGRARGRSPRRGIRGRARGRSILRENVRASSPVLSPVCPNFDPVVHSLHSPNYIERNIEDAQWYDFFSDYFDDEIFKQMVEATNRTYVFKKGKSLELTTEELKTFFGMLMVMATINYPIIDYYWSQKWRIPQIADVMTRDRFYAIRTNLKVVYDAEITAEQRQIKIWKVFPLFQKVLGGCLIQERQRHISIDEMIVPFTGVCGIKQYCPNKPNPVGLKIFVAANPNGMVLDMVVYQGDKTFTDYKNAGFSLGESAVLKLTESLVPGHYLYFDRYFSTVKLLKELKTRGFNASGTIMRNRIPRECALTDDKIFQKKSRGSSEVRTLAGGDLAITKWLDNKPVLMISTCLSDEPTDTCRRWNKTAKAYQYVRRPEVVKQYNTNMGGVDLADRFLSVCPARSRTKKWTIRFICHMLDLAVSNSWNAYRLQQQAKGVPTHKINKLRQYKLNLGVKIITDNNITSDSDDTDAGEDYYLANQHKRRRVAILPVPPLEKRSAHHLPEYTDNQMRCRKEGCNKKSTVICQRCKIYLCMVKGRNCFSTFHSSE